MKVLVTGAGGYLGRHVVRALHRRGYEVRALDLPRAAPAVAEPAPPGVEEFQADLCASPDLPRSCQGVQAVVHLAARLQGDDESVVATAVEGTRRLLDAMEQAGTRHLVLASSLSVYDWAADSALHEDALLEPHPEARDAYTVAKLRQEELARARCARSGIALTVLRPAVIWGAGREYPPTIGQSAGPFHLVVAADRPLVAAHVENCADAFAAVLDAGRDGVGTFNVVDHPEITVWQFARDHLRRSGRSGIAIPVAYRPALAATRALYRLAPGPLKRRLPSFVAPARFTARYRPVQVDGVRLRHAIGWRPPLAYEQCLDRTYGARSAG